MLDISSWVEGMSPTFQDIVAASFYLLVTVGIAWLIDLFVYFLSRFGVSEQKHPIACLIIKNIRVPLAWTVIVLGLKFTIEQLQATESIQTMVGQLAQTIFIVVWGQFIFRTVRFILRSRSKSANAVGLLKPQTLPLFDNLTVVLLFMLGMYLTMLTWHIDMTAWLASAGVVGIAVGFAAKDTLANLFAGVFILADAPYQVKDYIVIDTGERGRVTHIGLRSTRIRTFDDTEISIPNSVIANGKLINETKGKSTKIRTRIAVTVPYGSDVDKVKQCLKEEAINEELVCNDPEPRVRLTQFTPLGLEFNVLFWVLDPKDRDSVIDIMNTAVYKRLALEGIEIPYNKHDIYIKQMPGTNHS